MDNCWRPVKGTVVQAFSKKRLKADNKKIFNRIIFIAGCFISIYFLLIPGKFIIRLNGAICSGNFSVPPSQR